MKRGAYKTAIMDFDLANRVSIQKLSAGESQEAIKLRYECVKKMKDLAPAERKTHFKAEEVEEKEIDLVMPKSGPTKASKRPIIEVISEGNINDEGIEEIVTEATMAARHSRTEVVEEVSKRSSVSEPFMKEISTRSIVEEPLMKEVSSRSIVPEPLMKEVPTPVVKEPMKEFPTPVVEDPLAEDVSIEEDSIGEGEPSEFMHRFVPNLGGAIDTLAVFFSHSQQQDVATAQSYETEDEDEFIPTIEIEDVDDFFDRYSIEDVSDFDDTDNAKEEASEEDSDNDFPTHERASTLSEFEATWRSIMSSGFNESELIDFILKHNSGELAAFFAIDADTSMIRDVSHGLREIWDEHPSYVREVLEKIWVRGDIKAVLERFYESKSILRDLVDLLVLDYPDLAFQLRM
jgi:hypothetical protein